MFKKLWVIFTALFFIFSSTFCTAQIVAMNGKQIHAKELDRFLTRQMELLEIPGMSIAFINNGKIVYNRSIGYADVTDSTTVNSKTLFEAASMSKTVFAYYVLQLADRGVIALDTPLYKYLPYPDIAYDERYQLITARMVLCHTSGFPNWRDIPPDSSLKVPKGALYLQFLPGTKTSYSGEGYQYLAKVVAHQLHTTMSGLGEIVYKDAFTALGMNNSFFGWTDSIKKYKAVGYVNNGSGNKVGTLQQFSTFNAAAGLHTNATDLAHFIIALLNEKGIKKTSLAEMLKEQSHPDQPSPERDAWGLGIDMKKTPYGIRYSHSGQNGNFSGYFVFYKKQKKGLVFLINNNMAGMFFHKLEQYFDTGIIPAERKRIEVPQQLLKDYVGDYEIKPNVYFRITLSNGQLFLQQTNSQYNFELFARTNKDFFFKLDPSEISFIRNIDGKVVELQLNQGDAVKTFKKIN